MASRAIRPPSPSPASRPSRSTSPTPRVAQVAEQCADVSLLVNNAGIMAASPFTGSYGASKAAALALTNGARIELHKQGTLVVAVHASFIDAGRPG
jgi:short-subunit dehydrogenase